MKIRIHDQTVRLRLDPDEVLTLLETGNLRAGVVFGPGSDGSLNYALELSKDLQSARCTFENGMIRVVLPESRARKWGEAETLSLSDSVETKEGPLEILVEKDLRPGLR